MITKQAKFLATVAINLSVASQWTSLLFIQGAADSIANDLHFTVAQIGTLHSMRLSAMFFSLPFYAWMCYNMHRGLLIGLSLTLSAIITTCSAFFSDYPTVMLMNLLSGLAMGAVHPVARSLIPSYYPLEERGFYFGLIELASAVGGFVGVGLAVVFDRHNHSPISDYQTTYLSIGLIQLPMAFGSWYFIADPIYDSDTTLPPEHNPPPTLQDFQTILASTTFRTMVVQGMLGAFPWPALSMLILWFERMGLSRPLATGVFASVALGAALGGLAGGAIGDCASRCGASGKRYGRIIVSHFSVLAGVLFAPCLLFLMPYSPDYAPSYIVTGGLMGLFISWPAANNAAIQSDVLPQSLHPTSYAIQFWLEGAFSALSPMVVGALNDHLFNARDITPKGGVWEWNTYTPERKHELLGGLARSIVMVCCLFWSLCQLGYFIMYRSYPKESISGV